ncbi:hypothetical protein ACGFNP_40615 [Nonomuraea sp. NPDC049269]|uniref:hypothetical protein n=1 Tax=Nonomuraea sp. NPDC049269 TaxID=3364349 RepID=UPI00371B2AFF
MAFQTRSTPGLPALGGVLGFGAFLALLNSTVVVVGIDRLSGALGVYLAGSALTTVADSLTVLVGARVIIDHLSWRWLFAMNLPLGLLAVVLSLRVLPRDRPETGTTRLDVLGLLLLSLGLAVLLYGLTRAGDGFGAGSVAVLAPVLGGTALLLGYAAHALRRGPGALIDIRLFESTFWWALAICVLGSLLALRLPGKINERKVTHVGK